MVRLFCLLAVILLVRQADSVSWEFGQDSRSSVVISQISGHIGPIEKVKQISIPVPPCMEIKYVLVEVENLITTPAVSYNRNTNTVKITYKLLQSSFSQYDIMAKGKRSSQCDGGGGGGGGGSGGGQNSKGSGSGGGGGGRNPKGGGRNPKGDGRNPKGGGGGSRNPGGGGGVRFPGGGGLWKGFWKGR